MKLNSYASSHSKRGFSLLELTVVMAVLGILLAAGLYGFNRYIENANGSACTRQLADVSRAISTVVTLKGLITDSELAGVSDADIAPYLGGKTLNAAGSSGLRCPAGGTYTKPTAFVSGTNQPNDPTCSIATSQSDKFKGTRLHSLQPVP